jgi:hypothetical protein
MQKIPRDEWVPRFAKKLRQLQPGVPEDDAMGLALAGVSRGVGPDT